MGQLEIARRLGLIGADLMDTEAWPRTVLPVAFVLCDVGLSLGLTPAQLAEVLGPDGTDLASELLDGDGYRRSGAPVRRS